MSLIDGSMFHLYTGHQVNQPIRNFLATPLIYVIALVVYKIIPNIE